MPETKQQKQTIVTVSLRSDDEKQRFTEAAEAHGLSLSAFFRLCASEYILKHDWDRKAGQHV